MLIQPFQELRSAKKFQDIDGDITDAFLFAGSCVSQNFTRLYHL